MNSAIHPLASCKTGQLQEIVQIIVKAVGPEYVYVLGVWYTRQQSYNIFSENDVSFQQVSHYDLLVLLPAGDRRNIDEVQDIIESRCRLHTPVTTIIFSVSHFNELSASGHPFCQMVYSEALMVYESGHSALAAPQTLNSSRMHVIAAQAYEKWIEGASEFLAGAGLYIMRKQWNMAAFMLHQAAERSYVAMIQVITGYRAGTHNLEKLYRYARNYSAGIYQLFPRNNEKEERLFRQLQKAYIHSRYKDDYNITGPEIQELADRVTKLLELVKQVCEIKLSALSSAKALQAELRCFGKAV
ncbi:MAG TPA: HEPN domain-containing protein [Chitinophagaceae bacterium]